MYFLDAVIMFVWSCSLLLCAGIHKVLVTGPLVNSRQKDQIAWYGFLFVCLHDNWRASKAS